MRAHPCPPPAGIIGRRVRPPSRASAGARCAGGAWADAGLIGSGGVGTRRVALKAEQGDQFMDLTSKQASKLSVCLSISIYTYI